jgi:hypothetical protein
MTDLQSDAAGNASANQRREASLNTIALVSLCGVFAALDALGIVYILVKRPGQDLTTLVTIGGVVILIGFVALIGYFLTNPVYARPGSATPARPARRR